MGQICFELDEEHLHWIWWPIEQLGGLPEEFDWPLDTALRME